MKLVLLTDDQVTLVLQALANRSDAERYQVESMVNPKPDDIHYKRHRALETCFHDVYKQVRSSEFLESLDRAMMGLED